MNWRSVLAFLAACLLLPAISVFAAPQAPSSPSSQATFKSNSELVLVPVHVSDSYGRPRHGLQRENFVLKSDGNPQRIALFEEVQGTAPAPTPPAATALTNVASTPRKFSNLPTEGLSQRMIIVALDMVNTPVMLQGWAKNQAIKYFSSHSTQQPFAVVAITPGGLRELSPFTSDTAQLIAAIKQLPVRLSSKDSQEAITSYLDPFGRIDSYPYLRNAEQERDAARSAGDIDAGSATLHNFEQLAWAYSGVPGRKTVLWLTSGFPISEEVIDGPVMLGHISQANRVLPYSGGRLVNTLLPQFQRAFTALNKADVIVYPIDVKGFETDGMWDVTLPAGLFIHPELSHLYPLLPDNSGAANDGMNELAHRTGGKKCVAGNSLSVCMQRALDESSDYYLLGFYVPAQERKDGWHKLKVAVNVEHGEVRSRSTYYLRPLGAPPPQEQEEDLRSAIHAGVEYTGIFFNVEPAPKRPDAKAPIAFRVTVPASSIQLLPDQDKLSYDVIAIPLSSKSEPLGDKAAIVNIDVAPKLVQKALTKGWNLTDFVPIQPGLAAIKVIIRDNDTGRVGSVVFPFTEEVADKKVGQSGSVN